MEFYEIKLFLLTEAAIAQARRPGQSEHRCAAGCAVQVAATAKHRHILSAFHAESTCPASLSNPAPEAATSRLLIYSAKLLLLFFVIIPLYYYRFLSFLKPFSKLENIVFVFHAFKLRGMSMGV